MKKKLFIISTVLALTAVIAVNVVAVNLKLSTALDNISAETVMVKSAAVGKSITFSPEDFETVLGAVPSQIKITDLPDPTDGKLMLGTSEIFEGQTISASNFQLLRFEPAKNTQSSDFEFTATGAYRIKCMIKVFESGNTVPVAVSSACAVTQKDITCYGSLSGYDADGDSLVYEIVSYPTKGLLTMTDKTCGNFTYTPYDGVVGVDSFSYRIRDEYGNYSDECSVNLEIVERATDVVLSDMDGHWAHNAALSAIADGSMDMISEMGSFYFDPEEVITREEYLKAVMTALGADSLPDKTTVFADDNKIGEGYGGYVCAAYKLGIIKGETVNGKLYFRPDEPVSRAEASVILNRILGAESESVVPVFSDFDKVPVWAEADMRALSSIGILSGNANYIAPMRPVTRAETAQMIYAAKNLYM